MRAVSWVRLLIPLVAIALPAVPATINVGGTCNLPDAIDAANLDAPIGGCDAGSATRAERLIGSRYPSAR